MITGIVSLDAVELDDNLILSGIENNADSAWSVRDLLGGPAVIQVDSRDVGARLNLTALNDGGRRQGQLCQHQIDSLKASAKLLAPVTLIHPIGTFTVFILDFAVIETNEREEPHVNKKYHGNIILQEV